MTTGSTYVRLAGHDYKFVDCDQDAWLNELKAGNERSLEIASLSLWRVLLLSTNVVFDIGSYNGMYSLVSARTRPQAVTVAFEPMPLSYGTLVLNLLGNAVSGSVVALNAALGDRTGHSHIASLFGAYVMASGESLVERSWPHEYSVQVLRLDDVWQQEGAVQGWGFGALRQIPNLIKIDVEGAESSVLVGMSKTLEDADPKPDIIVECLTPESLLSVMSRVSWASHLIYVDDHNLSYTPLPTDGTSFAQPGNYWITNRTSDNIERVVDDARRIAVNSNWGVLNRYSRSRNLTRRCSTAISRWSRRITAAGR